MTALLTIPVFNEAASVEGVLRQARRYIRDILVVDDGSTDRTGEILARQAGIRILRHDSNMGYGQALIDAFAHAAGAGYEWIITMDCDGQHEPAQIPAFLERAERNDCDIISGSRYLDPDPANDSPPADRQAINAEITSLVNERLHLGLTDAFCGFKAYRVDCLGRLNLTEPGYAMPLQLWVRVARRGLSVCEIPVRLIYNDPSRSFGGRLDDAEFRRRHYLEVFWRTMREEAMLLASNWGCKCQQ